MLTVTVGQGKPSYAALLELQTQGGASPIASPLLHHLSSVLAVAQHWLQRCTGLVARRPGQDLEACLEAMAGSVQRAQGQMESQLRKLQVCPCSLSPQLCDACTQNKLRLHRTWTSLRRERLSCMSCRAALGPLHDGTASHVHRASCR